MALDAGETRKTFQWDDPLDLAQRNFSICHVYNSAIDSSGMGTQVGRFLASYMTSYTALSSSMARSSTQFCAGSRPPAAA